MEAHLLHNIEFIRKNFKLVVIRHANNMLYQAEKTSEDNGFCTVIPAS